MTSETGEARKEPVAWRWILRSRGFVLFVVTAAAVFCGYQVAAVVNGRGDPPAKPPGILWPDGKALGAFSITDHTGQAFDLQRLRGRWTLLSFGYTHCPDVCPMTLDALKRALDDLAARGESTTNIQTVFVSVDPERDSLEHLGAWVGYFNPRFLGATGSHQALQGLTTQLGVAYRAGRPDARGFYLVDHTGSVMLIDPEARLVAIFGLPHHPAEIANRLAAIRAEG